MSILQKKNLLAKKLSNSEGENIHVEFFIQQDFLLGIKTFNARRTQESLAQTHIILQKLLRGSLPANLQSELRIETTTEPTQENEGKIPGCQLQSRPTEYIRSEYKDGGFHGVILEKAEISNIFTLHLRVWSSRR
jgi:hypothetical protein